MIYIEFRHIKMSSNMVINMSVQIESCQMESDGQSDGQSMRRQSMRRQVNNKIQQIIDRHLSNECLTIEEQRQLGRLLNLNKSRYAFSPHHIGKSHKLREPISRMSKRDLRRLLSDKGTREFLEDYYVNLTLRQLCHVYGYHNNKLYKEYELLQGVRVSDYSNCIKVTQKSFEKCIGVKSKNKYVHLLPKSQTDSKEEIINYIKDI